MGPDYWRRVSQAIELDNISPIAGKRPGRPDHAPLIDPGENIGPQDRRLWRAKVNFEDDLETSAFTEWGPSKELTERSPELYNLQQDLSSLRSGKADKQKPTPLPWFQFSLLLFLQLAEPLTSQVIYPFAPQLIRELDVTSGNETKVGYYVGFVESLFFLAQACTVLQWSRLSDHVGRKPIIIAGLVGLSISMYLFGVSRTFLGIVISRGLNGALNGNIGVIKSMIAEMTDATNISQAYAYLPIAWGTGGTIGPMIGGSLSRPTEQYPQLFGNSLFLKKYPYFLACAIPATFSVIAGLVAFFYLQETHHSPVSLWELLSTLRGRTRRTPGDVSLPLLEESNELSSEKPLPLRSLLTFRVLIAAANYASLSLIEIFFRALQPLFLATPIHLGGLGLPPSAIGHVLSTFGVLNGLFLAFFFARIHDRWGSKNVFMVGLSSAIPLFVLFPVISHVATTQGLNTTVWILVGVQVVLSVMLSISFGSIHIFIASASPNRASLGATNGFCQLSVSITRAIGPTMANSLFSLSIENEYMGGFMVYYVLLAAVSIALFIGSMLPRHI